MNIKEIKILQDQDFFEEMSARLVRALNTTIQQGKLIDITNMRMIGKTTTLINYAKVHGYAVIVHHEGLAKTYRKDYHYQYIYSAAAANNGALRGIQKPILVDEGIDLLKLYNTGIKISGGYFNWGC